MVSGQDLNLREQAIQTPYQVVWSIDFPAGSFLAVELASSVVCMYVCMGVLRAYNILL